MTCFSDAGVGAACRDALQPRVGLRRRRRRRFAVAVREGACAVRHVVPLLDGGRGAAPPADGENPAHEKHADSELCIWIDASNVTALGLWKNLFVFSAPGAGVVCGADGGDRDGDLRGVLDALLRLDAAHRAPRAPHAASRLQVSRAKTLLNTVDGALLY